MPDAGYEPQDILWLWWLGDPAQPNLVGELHLVAGGRGVALRYAQGWIARGFALSEDLPLVDTLLVPQAKDRAAGAVDDARPDRWGERVIRKFERSPRHSILEFLLFAGDDRYGCLGVSLRPDTYRPWDRTPLPALDSLEAMAQVVRLVLANETVPELQKRLLRPGVSLGGARPKSLVAIDGEGWLVKFSEGEALDTQVIEHAAMRLLAACGARVAPTRALALATGQHAVAVQRFDRRGAMRLHAISADVALHAAGEESGYPEFASLLRRLAPARSIAEEQRELFRRMVFNILVDNTDDHERNHALLRRDDGTWLLSPAFDVVPSAQGLGYQAMRVGEAGTESGLENALSQAQAFGLKPRDARTLVAGVAVVVDGWKDFFRQAGVADADLDILAQYLDGPRLGSQRRAFLAK